MRLTLGYRQLRTPPPSTTHTHARARRVLSVGSQPQPKLAEPHGDARHGAVVRAHSASLPPSLFPSRALGPSPLPAGRAPSAETRSGSITYDAATSSYSVYHNSSE